ncbi:transposase domain-containing protein [Azospirillum aestuarii]|uniref:transposase domain-containing protein n=1 Tax=Azospirillum aestuarii TaxID=2802052 RepID=UPI0040550532
MKGLTIATIATAMGLDRSRVLKRAQEEKWVFATERCQGGRRNLYPIGPLPADVRAKVEIAAARLALETVASQPAANDDPVAEAAAASTDAAVGWAWFDRQPQVTKDEARRKADALDAVAALVEQGMPLTAARETIAKTIGDSARTLIRWSGKVKGLPRADWLPALADQYCGSTRTAYCTPEAWEAFKADYLRQEQPTASSCYYRLQRAATTEGWTIPSLKTIERRIETEIPKPVLILMRNGPEALKRSFPHQTRDRSSFVAMQAVNADGHKFDVFVKWPDGTISRPVIVAFQDLYSGKILSFRIGRSESAELVRLAIRDMVGRWGIPEQCYLDNGRNFASKWITGGTATRFRFKVKDDEPSGALTDLRVNIHWTTPYWGQAKPIERAWLDFTDVISRHPVCAGAYTGNNPMAKPENYGSKAVPIATFEALVAQEIAAHNARPGRRSPTCAGRSLDETFAESYARAVVRRAAEQPADH